MPKRLLFSGLLMASVFGTSAQAALVEYSFNDADFEDGAVLSGTFTWDTDTNAITAFDIETTLGSVLAGSTYDSADIGAFSAFDANFIDFNSSSSSGGGRVRVLVDTSSLGASSIGTSLFFSSSNGGFYECATTTTCTTFREGTGSGFLTSAFADTTSVPLPAAGWLLIAGIGGLGMMRRGRS
ncbi:VPLPA-CTERM sorting domain-containing protein [Pseudooceanicola sp.]|uniref:VPLPA-CTERM sorting domain-containing protein n=2 Tax=Pseudooceanicola sp. TaxID=1914328 RepID=UPI0035C6BA27